MEQKDESYYIERILDGETEYFSVFLDRYSRPLYTLVVQIVGCPEDAEELLQDIFLKAFRNLNRYKGECRFSTWIYRIAYNAAISATRKKKQEFLYIEENTINNVPDEMADNVLAPAETEEQLERLEMAIDQLSGEEKALITMEEERKINENTGNMLKQALERRQTERLSSNFSYRMMERVHQEAEKQTKRKTRIGWAALLISALALVGLGVYVLTFYLEFNFADVMPQMNVRQDSSLFAFYVYIALLALVLLGLDYWLRKKYIWK